MIGDVISMEMTELHADGVDFLAMAPYEIGNPKVCYSFDKDGWDKCASSFPGVIPSYWVWKDGKKKYLNNFLNTT